MNEIPGDSQHECYDNGKKELTLTYSLFLQSLDRSKNTLFTVNENIDLTRRKIRFDRRHGFFRRLPIVTLLRCCPILK